MATLQVALDSGAYAPLAFDSSGKFSSLTTLPLDDTADGKHTLHFKGADKAGNASAITDYSFTLEVCPAWEIFTDWTAGQDGGSGAGQGVADVPSCGATLHEGNSFDVTLRKTFRP